MTAEQLPFWRRPVYATRRSAHVLFVPDSFDSGALGRLVEMLERAAEC